ncbi:hypothetical protein [Kitasatospora fiedleri]|uniref:hypothetical protein n=1 Tax=Kitasatospora fiedleri TaxID=2991545 RepID=UPI00249AE2D7|nr:hypothetical protein [Kitasatospora fiedleri]
MTPQTRTAALLAATAPCLLAALLAAPPAAASETAPDARPATHAAHRPIDQTHPVQPPPGRFAQGGPVRRAAPDTSVRPGP